MGYQQNFVSPLPPPSPLTPPPLSLHENDILSILSEKDNVNIDNVADNGTLHSANKTIQSKKQSSMRWTKHAKGSMERFLIPDNAKENVNFQG